MMRMKICEQLGIVMPYIASHQADIEYAMIWMMRHFKNMELFSPPPPSSQPPTNTCTHHRRTVSTIDMHSQLVDLLQIPQLMDTCARGGAIDEALELCSLARTLRTRHEAIAESIHSDGQGVKIVRWVADEVEMSANAMRRQLLQQLRGAVDLPTCLRLLSHLKRLDAQRRTHFGNPPAAAALSSPKLISAAYAKDEAITLKREFLDARDAYLEMQIAAATEHGDLLYQTALKVIQKNREIWFDVVTQYQAIFGVGGGGGGASNSDEIESSETLARWIGQKVDAFVLNLKQSVMKFENCGELGSVFELSSSFAASLARVGSDFRPLLPPIFVQRVRELMIAQWEPAALTFHDLAAIGNWGESLSNASLSSSAKPTTTDDSTPPMAFLAFPIVVDFVNSMLRSFNDLRSFAAVNCIRDLVIELKKCMDTVVLGLESYHASVANGLIAPSSGGKDATARFQQLLDMFANRVLPFLARGFASIFEWKSSVALLIDVAPFVDRVKLMIKMKHTNVVGVVAAVAAPLPVVAAVVADAEPSEALGEQVDEIKPSNASQSSSS